MSKLFTKLPNSIWNLIFQFDDTYHDIYRTLLKEFHLKSSFWRIKWLNYDIDYGRGSSYETIKYDSYRHQVLNLTMFWNLSSLPGSLNNATDVFITDERSDGHAKLLTNLKILKKYTVNKDTNRLEKLVNL